MTYVRAGAIHCLSATKYLFMPTTNPQKHSHIKCICIEAKSLWRQVSIVIIIIGGDPMCVVCFVYHFAWLLDSNSSLISKRTERRRDSYSSGFVVVWSVLSHDEEILHRKWCHLISRIENPLFAHLPIHRLRLLSVCCMHNVRSFGRSFACSPSSAIYQLTMETTEPLYAHHLEAVRILILEIVSRGRFMCVCVFVCLQNRGTFVCIRALVRIHIV